MYHRISSGDLEILKKNSKLKIKKKNKYHAVKCVDADHNHYDSKIEREVILKLKELVKKNEICNLEIKPRYNLVEKFKDSLGETERGVFFTPEARFFDMKCHKIVVLEVKSEATAKKQDYVIRRKLFKKKYPHLIFIEVRKTTMKNIKQLLSYREKISHSSTVPLTL